MYWQGLPIGAPWFGDALLYFMIATPLAGGGLRALLTHSALWVPFALATLVLVAFDLGLFRRRTREPTTKEAVLWSLVWLGLATVFGLVVYAMRGPERGVEFFTGYFVEQALSVDNLFVMMLIFAQLRVPRGSQRRVLLWGILGAVVLRGLLVCAGTAVVARFHPLTYALGALLVYGAVKLLREISAGPETAETPTAPKASRLRGLVARFVPITNDLHGERFTVVLRGVRHATPLLVALLTIEIADAVFALDSIPAVLGITTDPLVVLSSNLFAVLGLRSLFVVLARLLDRLFFLKHGVAVILLLVGAKMLFAWAWAPPAWVTLALVVTVLGVATAASLFRTEKPKESENAVRS